MRWATPRIFSLCTCFALVAACGGTPRANDTPIGSGDGGEGDSTSDAGRATTSRGGGITIGQGGRQSSAGNAGCTGDDCGGTGEPTAVCGDSEVEDSENCDDGNSVPGDGCNGNCRVESGGWLCETPGERCTTNLVCGDGLAGPNEACDDGNTKSGDGCAANCGEVEEGWKCPTIGELCVTSDTDPVCGNKAVEAGENCDDGNARADDGCGSSCLREEGYICPTVGQPCEKDEFCGDGVRNDTEECDDGNFVAGDCCSGACTLESNCACNDAEPQVCSSTIICGDGKVTGYEACDDSNTTAEDGCSADCNTVEPGWRCPATGGACAVATEPCGNATLDGTEECDDGDTSSRDGCSSACEVETGWRCPTVGAACETILFCGDGTLSFTRGETCDDGNNDTEDGCSEACKVEPGYRCTGSPSACVNTIVCGDKRISVTDKVTEQCDDGNTDAGDGCDAACTLEEGWVCPLLGTACQPVCGDGILVRGEQCDDGNTTATDGCDARCHVESPADDEPNGWVCPTPGAPCVPTTCGDGTPEGSEQCDDGNNDMGDGCSPYCRREPSCPIAGGACATACGDGMLLPIDKLAGQACDDGNTVGGDGCSATCQIEAGYTCDDTVSTKDPLVLPIVFRDFRAEDETGGHPDFEAFLGGETGIVQRLLGADGKPAHALVTGTRTANEYDATGGLLSPEDYFASWYRDNPAYNTTLLETLSLAQQATGEYAFADTTFFPLDGLGFGNDGNNHNFHFTSEVRYWFEYKGGETLSFRGDDDVWVFVNRHLAVDLGGVHIAQDGSVVLDASNGTGTVCQRAAVGCAAPTTVDLGLTLGSVYEIVVFQAERHTVDSNYLLTLSNFSATRSSCGPICGDGVVTAGEQCDLGVDDAGASLNTGDYGGCQSDCTLAAFCGDGKVDDGAGEVCDDGINAAPYGSGSGCAPGCILPPYCGDGNRDTDFGETCDLGEENSASAYGPEACLSDCQTAPFCGDGLRNGGEICDDGVENGTPDSACDTTCELKCGNGVLEAGEQCDEGSANNDGSYGGCRSNCKRAPYCGDGIKNGTEECDDGLNDGSYGTCEEGCTLAPYCGDRTVQEADGEVCDEGTTESSSEDYGEDICTARCLPGPFCGDGVVDTDHGEVCDDGNDNSATVAGACNLTCSGFNKPPVTCGNGKEDAGEECDDGTKNGTSGSACDLRCQLKCGNGFVEDGEECDDGTNDGTYGTCRSDCTLADYCGDGKKSGPEQCDLGDNNKASPYGKGTCTLQCKLGPYCGDGRIDTGNDEDCDGQMGCDTACSWAIPK